MSDKKERKSKDTKKEKSEGKDKGKDKSHKRKTEEVEGKQKEKCHEVKDNNKDKSHKRKYEEAEGKQEEKSHEMKEKIKKNKQEEGTEEQVCHSANDWEHADLGDDNRKNKFLRLMGANKEQKGKQNAGEKKTTHGRSKEETEKVSEELLEQYKQGLDMKLSGQARRHVGLGFHEGDTTFNPAYKSSNDEPDVPKDKPEVEKKKFGLFVKASK